MRHLFQAVQPQRQKAHVAPLRTFILLRVRPKAAQARRNPVSLRQKHTLDHARQPARELSSSDGLAHDDNDQPSRLLIDNGGKPDPNVRPTSSEKGQVLLHAGPWYVLLKVHLEAYAAVAHSYQLLA